jgi:hypothetical protein
MLTLASNYNRLIPRRRALFAALSAARSPNGQYSAFGSIWNTRLRPRPEVLHRGGGGQFDLLELVWCKLNLNE